MKSETLWRISVVISPEAEEAVSELLGNLFGRSAVVHVDANSGVSTVIVYCPGSNNYPRAQLTELVAGLARIKQYGLRIGPGRISAIRIRHQDWSQSWKRHFKPLEFGRTLLIKPSWSTRRPRKSQALVVLDPGLSFGTGHHPTTAFCLQQLVACHRSGQAQSFLDIGTGSGILAVTAARLGYAPVDAVDIDPMAIRVACANARRNRVQHKLSFHLQDLAKLPRRGANVYDIVCANLTSDLLLAEQDRILNRLRLGGILVLAGILRAEFPRIQQMFERAGLRLAACQTRKEWRSGAFRFIGEPANFSRMP